MSRLYLVGPSSTYDEAWGPPGPRVNGNPSTRSFANLPPINQTITAPPRVTEPCLQGRVMAARASKRTIRRSPSCLYWRAT